MTEQYLKQIALTTLQGDAREESYYSHLSNLLLDFSIKFGKANTQVTILPKKTEAGNPDFRVWDGKLHIIGYIEAKKPGENLDLIELNEQLKRYRNVFPNLILTDFYEFRLYRNGELIDKVSIGRSFITQKLGAIPPIENESVFISLLEKFFAYSFPKISTAEDLAVELAKRTSFLRDEIISKELEEEESGKGELYGFYEGFKKYLVATLSQKEFADIYSQTVTYGMFSARLKADNGFSRQATFYLIPQTIGILRDVFHFISLGKLPVQMEVIIDDIAEVLQAADVSKILNEYYQKGKGEDPIIHFYETFLNVYDPSTREKRGVYYTPEPVVKYIVRSVHSLLRTHFNLEDGLASNEVTLLDPAGGTLTFPAEAIKLAVKEYTEKYGEGGLKNFIRNNILTKYYAFEIMMAAYTIGHLKISYLLENFGFEMSSNDRFNLFLTNTLDMEDLEQTRIPGLSSLSDESHRAATIKKIEPILVIIGNPPYSGISANINRWTEKLLKENLDGALSYYQVDGKPLKEKKLWLQDDYVKFIRFAQWKIQKAGKGIVGMITNHSYLDNPTFRGMRQSLMNTFNEIYIIDLHGNALKKEVAPNGSRDENVFDIKQGVAIVIFVKHKDKKGCKVYHSDLYGIREEKYSWLERHKFSSRNYNLIKPESPWYFFIPRDTEGIESYNKWLKINEIFPINNVGVVTARDHFAIDEEIIPLRNRIRQFRDLRIDDEIIRRTFKLKDTSTFKLKKFRQELSKVENWEDFILPIQYRPFDRRYIYYSKWVVERPIYDTMKHIIKIKNNLGLVTVRQVAEGIFNHVFISDLIVESRITLSNKGTAYIYPLYIIPNNENGGNGDLFNPPKHEPEPNIDEKVYKALKGYFGNKLKPEQILYYVYAILYSNIFRKKYAEFLKIDFPRIPFTSDNKIFQALVKLGETLVKLHLLKHPALSKPISKFRGKGDNDKIEKIFYSEDEERVYINDEKYFDNISSDVWSYNFGGYQVMEKYLKDRKGKMLISPSHYSKIATCISKTIEIQNSIDDIFIKAEKKIIKFE